jgi:hypothetical protein
MPSKDEASQTLPPHVAAPRSASGGPSAGLPGLVLPSFLINLVFFYIQICGDVQPTSASRISLVAGPLSIFLSALAIISSIAYWSLRRRQTRSPTAILGLHFAALFPVLVASFRAITFIWGVILCLSTTECRLALLIAIGGGL